MVTLPMPTIEEILPELSKAKVFSIADARKEFWQVKLDVPSSYLMTFLDTFRAIPLVENVLWNCNSTRRISAQGT